MKTKTLGILLIVLGIIMIVYTGFNYETTQQVVEVGLTQLNETINYPVQWFPIVGAVILVGGILVLITGRKKYLIMFSTLNVS